MTEANIVSRYRGANDEERVVIIVKHYSKFMDMIEAYEQSLAIIIQDEKAYNRRSRNGDLGIRVASSKISNPTFDAAESEIETIKAIRNADFSHGLLADTDNEFYYKRQILTCKQMEADFRLFEKQFMSLDEPERVILKQYLSKEKDLQTLADEIGIEYESVRKRLRKSKRKVMDLTGELMQIKNRRRNQDESTVRMREIMQREAA